MREELHQAGLTENESKVYSTLLELGPSHAGLISRKSGLHRRVVYDTIEMLIQKGLVGYILQNGVKLFQASHPGRVLELIKEKEQYVNEIMPNMLGLYSKTKEKEETNFYKGKNGLKTVFEDQLATREEILILGASPLAYEILQFYFHWFDKRRVEKKIKTRIIFNRGKKTPRIPLSEIRFLPEKYTSPLAVNIYGDKVAIILWSKEKPFAIVINEKDIAEGYRKYFELMWKIARK
jgi:sugar-specific transcriptional regulator TrmB